MICAHEDSVETDSMVWSLIEREHFGLLTVWKIDLTNISETKLLNTHVFEQKISKLLTNKNCSLFIVGCDNGGLDIVLKESLLYEKGKLLPVW